MSATAVVEIDLQLLKPHPLNVRKDLGDLSELTASIQARGLLEPLVVTPIDPAGDAGYYVVCGERRLASLHLAGYLFADCLIRHDLADDVAAIVSMLVENDQRESLSTAERAQGYYQLQMLGLDAEVMAKETGTDLSTVETCLTIGSSAAVMDVLTSTSPSAPQVTFDQAAALAEFADDPKAYDQLVESLAAGTWDFEDELASLRADREEQVRLDYETGRLRDLGITVVTDRPLPPARSLRSLPGRDAPDPAVDGKHRDCPGHVVYIQQWRGGEPMTLAYCLDPVQYKHITAAQVKAQEPVRGGTKGGELTDAQREKASADRKEVIANNKAWKERTGIRRRFVKDLVSKRTAPKDVLVYVASVLLCWPRKVSDCHDTMLAELLGVAPPKGMGAPGLGWGSSAAGHAAWTKDKAGTRLPLTLLAEVAAAFEATMAEHCWRDTHRSVPEADYLLFLVSQGYQLSKVEQAVVDHAKTERKK